MLRLVISLLLNLGLVHELIDLEERDLGADNFSLDVDDMFDRFPGFVDQSEQLDGISEVDPIASGDRDDEGYRSDELRQDLAHKMVDVIVLPAVFLIVLDLLT